jgi:hypothetical protein
MNIVLSFIGYLPEYIIYTVYQIRLFTDIPIYLIYNDYSSKYINIIKKYNINFIKYDEVNKTSIELLYKHKKKFAIINNLKNRSELFFRSFERFYLLHDLIKLKNLTNILFLEIDNLIYDNPTNWLDIFKNYDIAFMIDNINRISTGISFFKDVKSAYVFLNSYDNYIVNIDNNTFCTEMGASWDFYINNKNIHLLILPCHNEHDYNLLSENFNLFNTIFDPSSYGIYLLGFDPFHANNPNITHKKNPWSILDCTDMTIEWILDNNGYKKPYLINNDKKILINNLHIHSKNLKDGLSKEYILN